MMSKLLRPLAAVLLAALLLALPVAAAPAEGQTDCTVREPLSWRETELLTADDFPDGIPVLATLQTGQTAEEVLLEGLQNRQAEINLYQFRLSSDEAFDLYFQVVYSHPELFYVRSGASVSSLNGFAYYLTPYYVSGFDDLSAARRTFDARVDEILAEAISPGMTDLQKALSLHDYVVLQCDYHINGGESIYTAYGSLVEGKAVCQGYALGYNLLLQRAGVDCRYVSSEPMNHGWSLVKLDGQWYHVDVTWDDPTLRNYSGSMPGLCAHTFFLLSTNTIYTLSKPHYGFDTGDIACNSTTYESGYVFNNLDYCPFFWSGGQFRYVSAQGGLASSATLLASDSPAAGSQIIAQMYNGFLYFREFFGGTVFALDTITAQKFTVHSDTSGEVYGLDRRADGVYLTTLTTAVKLSVPLDGEVHITDPVGTGLTHAAVTVRNGSREYQTVSLCLAVYDSAGRLVSLDWQDVSLPSGESQNVALSAPASNAANAILVYLDDARVPLREATSLQSEAIARDDCP